MTGHSGDSLVFDGGLVVPVAAYAAILAILSGLLVVATELAPAALVGTVWGVVLAALAVAALRVEGVTLRAVLPAWRSLGPVLAVVGGFWAAANLVGFGLGLAGVGGADPGTSHVVGHPVGYVAALFSSLLFTALPEELAFRGYFQQKFVALAGGPGRRAAAVGVGAAAVAFALFHLPRWFLRSGLGVGPALAGRLLGLVFVGVTLGVIYELTRNLWLVVAVHGTANAQPWLVDPVVFGLGEHLLGYALYVAFVGLVALAVGAPGVDWGAGRGPVRTASDRPGDRSAAD